MQNRKRMRAKKYLFQLDEIVNQMADNMLSQEITNSITIYFIRCMIPHHQAAIEMSENVLSYIHYQPLENIAKAIMQTKTKEMEQMKNILKNTSGFLNYPKEVNLYRTKYLEITQNMMEKIKDRPRYSNIYLDFINEMISHHEGAIEMCKNLLHYRIDPRLKKVADDMIRQQSEGIRQLQQIKV